MCPRFVGMFLSIYLFIAQNLYSFEPREFIQKYPLVSGIVSAFTVAGALYGTYKLYKILEWSSIQRKSPEELLDNAQRVHARITYEYADILELVVQAQCAADEICLKKMKKDIMRQIQKKGEYRKYPLLDFFQAIEYSIESVIWQLTILSYKLEHSSVQFSEHLKAEYSAFTKNLLETHDHLELVRKILKQSTAYQIELQEKRIERLEYEYLIRYSRGRAL